jgi:hypothetical protein
MKKILGICLIAIFLFSCACPDKTQNNKPVSKETIDAEMAAGNFKSAEKMINMLLTSDSLPETEKWELNFKKDIMNRIRYDFHLDEQKTMSYIKNYYPAVDSNMMRNWEANKELEMRMIDGERKYFKYGKNNLFRLNKEAIKVKEEKDGAKSDPVEQYKKDNLSGIIKNVKTTKKNIVNPVNLTLNYTITVDTNAVPDGEVVRCWLPFPREGHNRQSNIKLKSINVDNYIISDNQKYLQRTLYVEKIARNNEPTVFQMEVSLTSSAEWYDLNPEKIKPYNKESELYKQFTQEKFPHVVFSDTIKKLTTQIVAGETNPLLIVRKIYTWIDENFPWASALEYSTIPCIPQYVIEQRHGDCGQQSLLFISMARYAGIPTKWQSGWMLHPNGENLHDWAEVYYEGIGWVPVDVTFELQNSSDNDIKYFYTDGTDPYHLIINDDFSLPLFPAKIYPRSETVDFQRGEIEWKGGNLYFDKWDYFMKIDYKK